MKILLALLMMLIANHVEARIHGSYGSSGHDYYTLNYVTVHPVEKLICYKEAAYCLEVGQDAINHFVDLKYTERKIQEDSFGYHCMLYFSWWAVAIFIIIEYKKTKNEKEYS